MRIAAIGRRSTAATATAAPRRDDRGGRGRERPPGARDRPPEPRTRTARRRGSTSPRARIARRARTVAHRPRDRPTGAGPTARTIAAAPRGSAGPGAAATSPSARRPRSAPLRGSVAAERAEIEAAEASPGGARGRQGHPRAAPRPHGLRRQVSVETGETSRLDVAATATSARRSVRSSAARASACRALQHLVNLMLSREMGAWTRVLVDVEDYRGRRERQLREIAMRAAAARHRDRQDAPARADARARAPLDPPRAAQSTRTSRPSRSARSRTGGSSCCRGSADPDRPPALLGLPVATGPGCDLPHPVLSCFSAGKLFGVFRPAHGAQAEDQPVDIDQVAAFGRDAADDLSGPHLRPPWPARNAHKPRGGGGLGLAGDPGVVP